MATKLPKELIPNPEVWRLYLELQPEAIECVMYSTMDDQSLMHSRLPLDTDTKSHLEAVEAAIYDNPLLLADFSRTSILIDTPKFMLIPEEFKDADTDAELVHSFWHDPDLNVITNSLTGTGMRIAMGLDSGVHGFLQRTFPDMSINHPLWALVTYFFNKGRLSNGDKMYVYAQSDRVSVMYFGQGQLRVANTFACANTDDMVYYVLMCAQAIGLNLKDDEVMLCGAPAVRERLATELRKYVRYVMPVIFPSVMYHTGKDALESPFELIILPLCE